MGNVFNERTYAYPLCIVLQNNEVEGNLKTMYNPPQDYSYIIVDHDLVYVFS